LPVVPRNLRQPVLTGTRMRLTWPPHDDHRRIYRTSPSPQLRGTGAYLRVIGTVPPDQGSAAPLRHPRGLPIR